MTTPANRINKSFATATPEAIRVMAAMLREACPPEALPTDAADDGELVEACDRNICPGWYEVAARAAEGDVDATIELRREFGLPAFC